MTVTIRRADPRDAELLAAIGRQSFDEAFSGHPKNHPDDMKVYMDEAFAVETVAAELEEPNSLFFIAELGGEAAGYAKIRLDVWDDGVVGERPIELVRLYALDKFIGKGVGKALIKKYFEVATETDRDVAWLGVWEFNFRAQEFYKKSGFEKCGEHVFQLGSDPQTDWIMQKSLAKAAAN